MVPSRDTVLRVVAVVGGIAVVVLAAGSHLWVTAATDEAATELQRSRERRSAVADEVAAVEDDLLAAAGSLAEVGARLDDVAMAERVLADETTILARHHERLVDEIGAGERDLGVAVGSLDGTTAERAARATRITTLRACLSGVSRALTMTSFGDGQGAARALEAVAPRCESAGAGS